MTNQIVFLLEHHNHPQYLSFCERKLNIVIKIQQQIVT